MDDADHTSVSRSVDSGESGKWQSALESSRVAPASKLTTKFTSCYNDILPKHRLSHTFSVSHLVKIETWHVLFWVISWCHLLFGRWCVVSAKTTTHNTQFNMNFIELGYSDPDVIWTRSLLMWSSVHHKVAAVRAANRVTVGVQTLGGSKEWCHKTHFHRLFTLLMSEQSKKNLVTFWLYPYCRSSTMYVFMYVYMYV